MADSTSNASTSNASAPSYYVSVYKRAFGCAPEGWSLAGTLGVRAGTDMATALREKTELFSECIAGEEVFLLPVARPFGRTLAGSRSFVGLQEAGPFVIVGDSREGAGVIGGRFLEMDGFFPVLEHERHLSVMTATLSEKENEGLYSLEEADQHIVDLFTAQGRKSADPIAEDTTKEEVLRWQIEEEQGQNPLGNVEWAEQVAQRKGGQKEIVYIGSDVTTPNEVAYLQNEIGATAFYVKERGGAPQKSALERVCDDIIDFRGDLVELEVAFSVAIEENVDL